jgi:hypothetical protein
VIHILIFPRLPTRLRRKIYKYILFLSNSVQISLSHNRGCCLFSFAQNRPLHCTAILRTRPIREIHDEAARVLYGANRFTVEEETQGPRDARRHSTLLSFLSCISRLNAGCLREVTVTFPGVRRTAEVPRFGISEEGRRILERVRECMGLVMVGLLAYGDGAGFW